MKNKHLTERISQLEQSVQDLTNKNAGIIAWAKQAGEGLIQIPTLSQRLDALEIKVNELEQSNAGLIDLPELPALPEFGPMVAP